MFFSSSRKKKDKIYATAEISPRQNFLINHVNGIDDIVVCLLHWKIKLLSYIC